MKYVETILRAENRFETIKSYEYPAFRAIDVPIEFTTLDVIRTLILESSMTAFDQCEPADTMNESPDKPRIWSLEVLTSNAGNPYDEFALALIAISNDVRLLGLI